MFGNNEWILVKTTPKNTFAGINALFIDSIQISKANNQIISLNTDTNTMDYWKPYTDQILKSNFILIFNGNITAKVIRKEEIKSYKIYNFSQCKDLSEIQFKIPQIQTIDPNTEETVLNLYAQTINFEDFFLIKQITLSNNI